MAGMTLEMAEMIGDYQKKSQFIEDSLNDLIQQRLISPNVIEENNVRLILKTNRNNLDLLDASIWEGVKISRMTFWFLKKTVDKNLKTVESMLKRKVF